MRIVRRPQDVLNTESVVDYEMDLLPPQEGILVKCKCGALKALTANNYSEQEFCVNCNKELVLPGWCEW